MAKLFANSRDPDQSQRVVASDLGLHFFPFILIYTRLFLYSPDKNGVTPTLAQMVRQNVKVTQIIPKDILYITKTRLYKYTENFTTEKLKIFR